MKGELAIICYIEKFDNSDLIQRIYKRDTMNYARAVKSGQMTEKIVNSIQSQSMIELGKELTGEEKHLLFSHIQPSALLEQIDKVRIKLLSFH